ncbi:ABC transporter related protein [Isosphaera pallida ATCC 43644]|jgi:lipopolysaccharide export system ATP-binding protein|uniref:ABC transporter related protein n=1 Tax=Isosphaera pallida (strain ATCC 43644 / DSM 9630 / IS1B) TaxID=575540 RepID=E8R1B9_ISOPI|nr:LPS export ABC transporter ATP-binding protein [Isosphaera pallida]ADV61325.1 ABC transporter related protein [Isosphaera pallida ATCC 43644]
MPLLEARNLQKWYKKRQVVKGVGFEVDRGRVVGLLGPNGAGKTTSFRMTIGLIDADDGQVFFDGQDVTNWPMYKRARAGMGYLAQDSSVFKMLSVEDNLMAILETRPLSRKERIKRQNELLDLFDLTKIRRNRASSISGGERRRLEFARSLITEPKLILLDEPFAGIDPITVSEIRKIIRRLAEQSRIAILITDHAFRETLQVTDTNIVIANGSVIATGTKKEIINHPAVIDVYIGMNYAMDLGDLESDDPPAPPQVAAVSMAPTASASQSHTAAAAAGANAGLVYDVVAIPSAVVEPSFDVELRDPRAGLSSSAATTPPGSVPSGSPAAGSRRDQAHSSSGPVPGFAPPLPRPTPRAISQWDDTRPPRVS